MERLRRACRTFLSIDPFVKAAAISFFAMASLAPLLLVLTAGVGLAPVSGEVIEKSRYFLAEGAQPFLRSLLKGLETPDTNVYGLTVGLFFMLFGASSVFAYLQRFLGEIWGSHRSSENAIKSHFRRRLIGAGTVLIFLLLLLASLAVDVSLVAGQSSLDSKLPGGTGIWRAATALGSFLLAAGLLTLLYRVLAEVSVSWRSALVGGSLATLVLVLGKQLTGVYVGRSAFLSLQGAAGSMTALLAWVYFASLVFLIGALVIATIDARAESPGS